MRGDRALTPRLRLVLGWLSVAVLAGAVLAGVLVLGADADNDGGQAPGADTFVTVDSTAVGRPVRPGFVGLSIEYPALTAYTGSNPGAVDPVFLQLIRNLAPGQPPVLRIGGDSTDTTWWPTAHERRPAGVSFTLTRRWLAVTRALARDLGARLILGVDLEADRPELAASEARALLAGIGARRIQALEIGNEAPRYGLFAYYHVAPDHPVFARPKSYDYQDFVAEFSSVARLLPPAPLAGPTLGGYGWKPRLSQFLKEQPGVRVVTFHRYPLNRCFIPANSPIYPTIPRLLTPSSSRGLAAGLTPYVAIAHASGDLFRLDELNSVACGGKYGVSNTFASALWVLDTVFALASVGVDGVNIHNFPAAAYSLFRFHRVNADWRASVAPEYYGLLMFARAAPPGSRLLRVATHGNTSVRIWATRAVDGTTRIVLINDDPSHGHVVQVQTPSRGGMATIVRLRAPSVHADRDVTFGGQSFGTQTSTGVLGALKQTRTRVSPAGRCKLNLPAASAALITIDPPR